MHKSVIPTYFNRLFTIIFLLVITPILTTASINIIAPEDNELFYINTFINFTFNYTEFNSAANCSIYFNSTLNQTLENLSSETQYSFNKTFDEGTYLWHINCTNGTDINLSSIRAIIINLTLQNNTDTQAPIVKDITLSDSRPAVNELLIIRANITDSNNFSFLPIIKINGINYSMELESGSIFRHNLTPSQSLTYSLLFYATDIAGNTNNTEGINFTTAFRHSEINSVFNANIISSWNYTTNLSTYLQMRFNSSSGDLIDNMTVDMYSVKPLFINATLPRAVKFVDINTTENVRSQLNWSIIRVYYTSGELDSININESTVSLKFYNESLLSWTDLSSGSPSWVNNKGIDMTNNYAWVNVTHFSMYGLSGSYNACSVSVSGAVTACNCGGTDYSSGYCCNNIWSSSTTCYPACSNSVQITAGTTCKCGSSSIIDRSSGYCCSGIWQLSVCDCPDGAILQSCMCGSTVRNNNNCCNGVYKITPCTITACSSSTMTNQNEITDTCICGSVSRSYGYCCSGSWSSSSCSSSVSSTGGVMGGYIGNKTALNTTKMANLTSNATLQKTNANKQTTLLIYISNHSSISALAINSTKNITTPNFEITDIKNIESLHIKLNSRVYKYIQINHLDFNDSEILGVKIGFKIEKAWLLQNNYSANNVVLERYKNGWIELKTQYINDNNGSLYYEADSPGLSIFAIAVKGTNQLVDNISIQNNYTELNASSKPKTGIFSAIIGMVAGNNSNNPTISIFDNVSIFNNKDSSIFGLSSLKLFFIAVSFVVLVIVVILLIKRKSGRKDKKGVTKKKKHKQNRHIK